jgi:uncharacterized protein (TIGR03067 family)
MRRACSLALLVLMMLLTARVNADEKTAPPTLDGAWLPISAHLAGQPLPDAYLKLMKLVMAGDKYTVTIADKLDKGTIKLDAAAQPKTIDVTGTEGPNAGKTYLAIYELTGDTLRVCYDLSGKGRPGEFKSAQVAPYFLVSYQREK